jgi:hypothetical protein
MEGYMSTPSQDLAKKVVQKLVEGKLILADDMQPIIDNLSLGKLRQEDWRLAVEKGLDAEKRP